MKEKDSKPWGIQKNTFLMLLHLSQFAGFILPGAGLILPIVMWITNKDEFLEVDRHGRVILNWIFSVMIYYAICFVLVIFIIGFLLLPAIMLANFIFVIIGAVKANDGELWCYPLSIPFFSVP